jgi:predicted dehydrogenase
MSLKRRDFLRGLGAAGTGMLAGFPTIVPGSALAHGADAPSERIRVGFIGVRNQGANNLKAMIKNAVAVCDVDENVLAKAKDLAEKGTKHSIKAFSDYRKLLDDKEIDAVLVTVPDHWHALITIDACAAGKDVYCEKPLSLTIAEGRAMVNAARKYDRVVQTGSQQRSDNRFRLACELVRSGRLGKLQKVTVGLPKVNFDPPAVPDTAPPPELDYDFWLGPAPERPYNPKRVHYLFRFFWDYSGGQLTNFGAHHLDIVQWALDKDNSGPVSVSATSTFHKDGWFEVPETSRVVFTYADGLNVISEQAMGARQGVHFEGEKGSIFVDRKTIESTPREIVKEPLGRDDVHLYVSKNHHADWLACIQTRKRPIADVEIGHRSATVCHLGNIAIRSGGRTIQWDPAREVIVHDTAAAKMLSRPYRSPWRLTAS